MKKTLLASTATPSNEITDADLEAVTGGRGAADDIANARREWERARAAAAADAGRRAQYDTASTKSASRSLPPPPPPPATAGGVSGVQDGRGVTDRDRSGW